jgi:hypothetical protein
MKTNHRRIDKNNFNDGHNYSYLTSVSLMRHGCSPNFTRRAGAMAAIRGKKKKDERSFRHKHNQAIKVNSDYEFQCTAFGKFKAYKG